MMAILAGRLARLPLGKLFRCLLLPVLLLVAQHGALLHEFSHYGARGDGDPLHSIGHPCELCLAFAQVESTATHDFAPPALLDGLSFARVVLAPATPGIAQLVSQRNRGPPAPL